MTPLQYCREKAVRPGSNAHYCVYFSERERQPALIALFALHAELSSIVTEVSDPGVGTVKLDWWRGEIERAFSGQAGHPVGQALQAPIQELALPRDAFQDLLDGVAMDLEYGSYPSFAQLSVYCHRMGGAFATLLTTICGYQDRATLRYSHHLGMGLQLMRLLRSAGPAARRGHVYIPEDELAAHGLDADALHGNVTSEALQKVFAAQASRIEDFYRQAREELPARDAWAQRSGLILAELDGLQLSAWREEGFPLLEKDIQPTPIRKFWYAWRVARRQKRFKRAAT